MMGSLTVHWVVYNPFSLNGAWIKFIHPYCLGVCTAWDLESLLLGHREGDIGRLNVFVSESMQTIRSLRVNWHWLLFTNVLDKWSMLICSLAFRLGHWSGLGYVWGVSVLNIWYIYALRVCRPDWSFVQRILIQLDALDFAVEFL